MDLEKIWKAVLSELELTLTRLNYRTMFTRTSLVSVENNVAKISCSNPYVLKMIEERYYSLLKNILDKLLNSNLSLVFVVKELKQDQTEDPGPLFDSSVLEASETGLEGDYIKAAKMAHLRTDLTFETYAVSPLNQFAYAAATAVGRTLGAAYNPLFIWGGVGVGKTHLMQAVGNSVLKEKPAKSVIFCMGEEFTNEIVDAIQNKTTKNFKDKYRNVDLLLVDDVQFLAGKNFAQEEFFHTFNVILREGGQIIMTCDRPPSEIKIEDRLRSRFEAGLIVDIQKPDLELRTAIVRIKAKQKGIDLPMELAQFLAAENDNPRALEGSLNNLLSRAQANKEPVSIDLAKKFLNKKGDDTKRTASPNEVIKIVSDYYGVKIAVIKSEKRDRPIVVPRQILMYLLNKDLRLTLMQVAELLEKKDHTTILHGVKKIERLVVEDIKVAYEIEEIKKRMYSG